MAASSIPSPQPQPGTKEATSSQRQIAELQCSHRLCLACLTGVLKSRSRECPECRAKCLAASKRRINAPVRAEQRAARRHVLLRAERFATIETLTYEAGEESDDEPPPSSQRVNPSNMWRDMSGDARTTRQMMTAGGYAQCSLATARNLFRDQSYSAEELAASCVEGEIRFPKWKDVLEPLRSEQEVFRRFNAECVPSELLSHVRLAARSRINSIHVTALVLAENGRSFHHYDNDSASRQRGTADVVSLRAAWGPFTLWALLPGTSPLCAAIDALPPAPRAWLT